MDIEGNGSLNPNPVGVFFPSNWSKPNHRQREHFTTGFQNISISFRDSNVSIFGNHSHMTTGSFYILFQNLQNKFQVQESRISLDTMQSIIYRRIKYILYIADKPWWVLHMYSMYVNFYVHIFFTRIKKP